MKFSVFQLYVLPFSNVPKRTKQTICQFQFFFCIWCWSLHRKHSMRRLVQTLWCRIILICQQQKW